MRNRLRVLAWSTLLALASPAAWAQTVYGPDGLFIHPTAFVAPRGSLALNVSWFMQNPNGGKLDEWTPVSLIYGVSNRLEAGGLFFHHGGGDEPIHAHLGAFVKYQLTADTPSRPAFALAGGFMSRDERQDFVSGVVSHRIQSGDRTLFLLHTGVLWARTPAKPTNVDDTAGFLGVEVPIGRGFRLVGEQATRLKFDRRGASAVGIMWTSPRGMNVGIGWVNAGRSVDNRFFIGVGYPLGGGR